MGRRKDSPAILEAKRQVARLIKAALAKGRHAKADPRPPQSPIEPRDFAKAIGQDPSLGPKWCNEESPTTPTYISQILDGLFGDNPAFAEEREALADALYRANRRPRPVKAVSDDTDRRTFSDYAHPVILEVNQRTPDNQGNIRIPFTLRFQYDTGWKFAASIDGKDVPLTLDIGITKVVYSVMSNVWQPTADSIFRLPCAVDAHFTDGPIGDSLWITGPVVNDTILSGRPFTPIQSDDDEPALVAATFERRKGLPSDVDGPVWFRVHADPDALRINIHGPVSQSYRQQDVINAICAEPIHRDERDRLEMAQAVERPPAKTANGPG